jgi:hypothetical protein
MPKNYDINQYDSRKLSRYNSNSSILDMFSEDIYFCLKDTKDNIATATSKLYDQTVRTLINDKKRRDHFLTITATLGVGFATAATFNLLGADSADAKNYVAEKISSHSFKLETIAHASFSFLTFMSMSTTRYMKEGNSFWKSVGESTKDLALLTAVSAPISLIAYNQIREAMVLKDIAEGIDPTWAVFKAQGKLVLPYYISVLGSLKLVKYALNYRNERNKDKIPINSNSDALENSLEIKSLDDIVNLDKKNNIVS